MKEHQTSSITSLCESFDYELRSFIFTATSNYQYKCFNWLFNKKSHERKLVMFEKQYNNNYL